MINNSVLSHAINEEFPNSVSKRAGDRRYTYVYGIAKGTADQSSLEVDLIRKNQYLQQQVEQLQQRVIQLEQESALARKLDDQIQSLLRPDMMSYHGPDTVAHLESFSLDNCITEFKDNAPDVVELIRQLGNCSRHEGDEDGEDSDAGDKHLRNATLRLTTVLCTLLKC